jgi:hypothetical protein
MSNRFTIRRQLAIRSARAKMIDAEIAARPGFGDRVVVGPVQAGGDAVNGRAVRLGSGDRMLVEEVRDGLEGFIGRIEAMDWDTARVRLDDGCAISVRRYRLAHATDPVVERDREMKAEDYANEPGRTRE